MLRNVWNQIFFGYLSKKWKRLSRTISFLIFSIGFLFELEDDLGVFFIIGPIGAFIVSYIMYPFVVKENDIQEDFRSNLSDIKAHNEDLNIPLEETQVEPKKQEEAINTVTHTSEDKDVNYILHKNVLISVGVTILIKVLIIGFLEGDATKIIGGGTILRYFIVYSIAKMNTLKYSKFYPTFKLNFIVFIIQMSIGALFEYFEILWLNG